MLKIILNRLQQQAEEIIAEEQAGFRAGRSTTEQIFNLRILCEKYLQHQQNLYHVFIDFKKAFDRVWHEALWATMRKYNINASIKVASSPRLSGIGMPSPILWYHSLKMQRIVLLSSLLWWELGTNSLITGPGEWLSFRRFTSKLSWSWASYEPLKICMTRPRVQSCSMAAQENGSELQ